MTMPVAITKEQRAEVARLASCDARTVAAYLLGDSVRRMVRERIEKALGELGLADQVRGRKAVG